MTREELHELVDIVMDARKKTGFDLELQIDNYCYFINCNSSFDLNSRNFKTFSDFTQAVKDYIKSLG